MRFCCLFSVSHLSLSFLFCPETQIIFFGYQQGLSFQELRNWNMRRGVPGLSELSAEQKIAILQLPLVNPQRRPSILPLPRNVCLLLYLSPEPSSKCTFKTELKRLFCLSPIIFQFPVTLPFLLALVGPLNTDPGDVASSIPSAWWGWQSDLFLEMCFFLFSFSWINTEKEAVPGWVSGFWKVKLN